MLSYGCASRPNSTSEVDRSIATLPFRHLEGCLPIANQFFDSTVPSTWNPYSRLLSGLSRDTRADWLKRFIEDFARAVRVKISWSRYAAGEFKQKYPRVVWIQSTGLKEMNESFWKIGGTEHYLSLLDEQIEKTLQAHPEWGELIHFNYKDRVIATTLTQRQVRDQLMPELRMRIAKELTKFFEQDNIPGLKASPEQIEASWTKFIEQHLVTGIGFDHVSAYLDLRGIPSVPKFKLWASTTTALRQELVGDLQALNLSFGELFTARRYYSDAPSSFRQWCKDKRMNDKQIADFENYWARLQVGDFLPLDTTLPPDQVGELSEFIAAFGREGAAPEAFEAVYQKVRNSWSVERTSFFSETLSAKYLIAVDIRGLGNTSAQSRDQWVANGAKLKDLPKVYNRVSKYLDTKFETLENELSDIVGQQVRLYRSGDDGLIAVPEVSAETLDKIKLYFAAKNDDLYSHIETVASVGSADDIAKAITTVRDELFSLKPAKPKD